MRDQTFFDESVSARRTAIRGYRSGEPFQELLADKQNFTAWSHVVLPLPEYTQVNVLPDRSDCVPRQIGGFCICEEWSWAVLHLDLLDACDVP